MRSLFLSGTIVVTYIFSGCSHQYKHQRPKCSKTKSMHQSRTIHLSPIQKTYNNFHTVEPGVLYRSAQLSRTILEKCIKKYHLKTIINLRGRNEHKKWWQQEKMLAQKYGLSFFDLSMNARSLPQKENLINLLAIYQNAPRPILIHCYSGADRTGEAAALWILEQQKKDKKTALKQLSLKYGHFPLRYPAKKFFIKQWQGARWLSQEYDPINYPSFTK